MSETEPKSETWEGVAPGGIQIEAQFRSDRCVRLVLNRWSVLKSGAFGSVLKSETLARNIDRSDAMGIAEGILAVLGADSA